MHYYDKMNGIKDFDIWFFYPFNESHLPYPTIWNWDYTNPKFGHHPTVGFAGRLVGWVEPAPLLGFVPQPNPRISRGLFGRNPTVLSKRFSNERFSKI
jgi:hypothetical protein